MKRLFLILILVLMAFAMMASTKTSSELLNNLLLIMSPIIVAGATMLGQRVMKWLGINIEDTVISKMFAEILRLIIEYEGKDITAAKKFTNVVNKAYSLANKKEKAIIEKRYGSIENFVEVVFDQSHVSKKPTKK